MKKIAYILLLIFSIFYNQQLFAQFITTGVILYEKKVNTKLQFKNQYHDKPDELRFLEYIPQQSISHFQLHFNEKVSFYEFIEHEKPKGNSFNFADYGIANENLVLRSLQTKEIKAKKKFVDAEVVLDYALPSCQWKIEDEIRTIAGYPCRKAVTTIYDSLIIVAFYTDAIVPETGPESIGGLPGMILGLAIPKLYTTWFATEVKLTTPLPEKLNYNIKGKTLSMQELDNQVEKLQKRWGDYANNMLWQMKI
jgi:GLPGLI family protein